MADAESCVRWFFLHLTPAKREISFNGMIQNSSRRRGTTNTSSNYSIEEQTPLSITKEEEIRKENRPNFCSCCCFFPSTIIMCCFRLCCCCCFPRSKKDNATSTVPLTEEEKRIAELKQQALKAPLTAEEEKDYDNLVYIAQKREIRVTIQKGTQAGLAAGLMVMGGVIVAGPVGAVVGGAAGTALAASISQGVVSLSELLNQTPAAKRGEVYRCFSEAMKEEFQDGFTENPELRLLMGGGSIVSVMRYALDKDLVENEKLEKLDIILKKIA